MRSDLDRLADHIHTCAADLRLLSRQRDGALTATERLTLRSIADEVRDVADRLERRLPTPALAAPPRAGGRQADECDDQ